MRTIGLVAATIGLIVAIPMNARSNDVNSPDWKNIVYDYVLKETAKNNARWIPVRAAKATMDEDHGLLIAQPVSEWVGCSVSAVLSREHFLLRATDCPHMTDGESYYLLVGNLATAASEILNKGTPRKFPQE